MALNNEVVWNGSGLVQVMVIQGFFDSAIVLSKFRYNMIHMAMTINLATNYNTKSSEPQDTNKLLTSCQDQGWGSSRELCKLYSSTRLLGISHFQVVLNLCFKAKLSAKPLIWKWFLFQERFCILSLVLKVRVFGTRKWATLSGVPITPQGQWGHARWHHCIWRVNRLLEPQFTSYDWILRAFYSLPYLWSFKGLNEWKLVK